MSMNESSIGILYGKFVDIIWSLYVETNYSFKLGCIRRRLQNVEYKQHFFLKNVVCAQHFYAGIIVLKLQ